MLQDGSVVKPSKIFFKNTFLPLSKLSKITICYSVSGVSTQLRNRVKKHYFLLSKELSRKFFFFNKELSRRKKNFTQQKT